MQLFHNIVLFSNLARAGRNFSTICPVQAESCAVRQETASTRRCPNGASSPSCGIRSGKTKKNKKKTRKTYRLAECRSPQKNLSLLFRSGKIQIVCYSYSRLAVQGDFIEACGIVLP